MHPDSRHQYHAILRSQVGARDFKELFVMIIQNDRYFFPAYLELLYEAEEREDLTSYRLVLAEALAAIKALASSKEDRTHITEVWSELETHALTEVVGLLLKSPSISLLNKLTIRIVYPSLMALLDLKTKGVPSLGTHLKLMQTLDAVPLQKELRALNPLWWTIDTDRAKSISHHRRTRSLVLRKLVHHDVAYQAVDGEHESTPTAVSYVLPRLHAAVLAFADEHRLALGRVVVVEANPHSQVYRHYDAESFYEGRDRYHLVLTAGAQNILSSGDETVNARPGEFWFFDNKVLHRAHNRSSIPRVHVIFDGYPLDGKG